MFYECDLGDGRFRNPILFADYSDPDVIRVGDTYYMTASSFNYVPGLPILTSKDLLHWKLVNYALDIVEEDPSRGCPHEDSASVTARFDVPRHSEGVWAPAIRYHNGEFFIFYGMPDEGCYMVKTADPLGKWEKPVCIRPAKGFIDTCPFWDDDGRAYIIHAYAKSRIGFKSRLGIFELSEDGTRAISEDEFIFDGEAPGIPGITTEGPKVMKKDGWYYILSPAGGVRQGWQLALRSRNIKGPYEWKVVMDQGGSVINGPHQGALVDTVSGDEWFLHFQDRGLYGRILHMQPVTWKDGWPVIGEDPDGDGCGDPVFAFKKPETVGDEPSYLEASDDFAGHKIGLMWQWLGNCRSSDTRIVSAAEGEDGIRLHAVNLSGEEKPILWHSANVLTEKLVLPEFTCDIVMKPAGLKPANKAGAAMMGGQYVSLCAERDAGGLSIVLSESEGGDADKTEKVLFRERIASSENEIPEKLTFRLIYERESGDKSDLFFANVDAEKPVLRMLWSADGEHFCDSTCRFVPVDHTWVGAKIGIFALSDQGAETGYADFLSVRVTELM